MKKRIISITLLIAIITTMLSFEVYSCSEFGEIEILIDDSYDNLKELQFPTMHGNVKLEKLESGNGNVVRLNSEKGSSEFFEFWDKPVSEDMLLVSFDLNLLESNNISTLLRAISDDITSIQGDNAKKLYNILWVTKEAQFAYFTDFKNWAPSFLRLPVTKNIWHHIDIWFDFNEQNIIYYVNGEKLGERAMNNEISQIKGFVFICETANGGGTNYFDNLKVVHVKEIGKPLNLEEKIKVPEKVGDALLPSFESGNIGDIFFDKNVKFNIAVKNNTQEDRKLNYSYKITDENGKSISRFGDRATKAGETVYIECRENLWRYGFYDIDINTEDESNHKIYNSKWKFSVVNSPDKGVVNSKMGTCVHFDMGHNDKNLEKMMGLYQNAGFVTTRMDARWRQIELSPGAYKLPDAHTRLLKYVSENDTRALLILAYGNPEITSESPPRSETEIAKFTAYAAEVAKLTKGLNVDFEVWNEYNLPGSFNEDGGTTEDYFNLLKATYKAVKAVNPEARVFAMGVANITVAGGYPMDTIDWMREVMQYGAGEYMDGVTIHPYATSQIPEGTDGNGSAGVKLIEDTKALLNEFGCGDKPIIASEIGWTSNSVSELQQAQYVTRMALMQYDALETFIWYVSQEKLSGSAGEDKFGWTKAWQDTPYPSQAKPVFVAAANINALLTDAKAEGRQKTEDNELYAYKFKRANGKDIYAVWTTSIEKKKLSLKLGAENAVIYDMYGNDDNLKAVDGGFNVVVSDSPVYLEGDFSDFQTDVARIKCIKDIIKVAKDDEASILIQNNSGRKLYTEFELPDNMGISSKGEFIDGESVAVIKVGYNVSENDKMLVYVRDAQSNELYYREEIPVTYTDALTCEVYPAYFREGRWQVNIGIKNNMYQEFAKGSLIITEPAKLSAIYPKINFSEIAPSNTKYITISIPEDVSSENITFRCEATVKGKEPVSAERIIYFSAFNKADKQPVIDGVINAGEWDKSTPMTLNSESMVRLMSDWQGNKDLSGKVYAMWDTENFYLAAEVEDNILGDTDEFDRVWACDSIQFAFTEARVFGGKRTEYGLGIVDGVPSFFRYSFLAVDTDIMGGKDSGNYDNIEVDIKRQGTKTYYEAKIPWVQIYGKEINPGSYKGLYFSLLINDNDGFGRRGWLEYCPGIGDGKNAQLFIEVPVLK